MKKKKDRRAVFFDRWAGFFSSKAVVRDTRLTGKSPILIRDQARAPLNPQYHICRDINREIGGEGLQGRP